MVAMGAAMVDLVEHSHAARTPSATAWVLCGGAAVVITSTMLVAATLPAWRAKRDLYRVLSRTCAAAAVGCLALGAARPAPPLLGLVLIALFLIPWWAAVTCRLRHEEAQ
ncbi:hypothetical protein [Streptomyces sp. DB-54]